MRPGQPEDAAVLHRWPPLVSDPPASAAQGNPLWG
jgi:hypothetical protein